MKPEIDQSEFEILFLGTGTSSAIPILPCLIDEKSDCETCKSTQFEYGKKNIRGNTSIVVQSKSKFDNEFKTILIDCGKTFYRDSLSQFPNRGLGKIDGLLLTHGHADAMYGLDDLRSWTMRSIQDCIDVYTNQDTFNVVCNVFPYMVDSSKASGGGDVPAFRWHIIEHGKMFNVAGVDILPANVEHGLKSPKDKNNKDPFLCLSFIFPNYGIYMSDVSRIPNETYKLIEQSFENNKRNPKFFILDCLKWNSHLSHFGFEQSLNAAYKVKPKYCYLTGFGHERTHDNWNKLIDEHWNNESDMLKRIKRSYNEDHNDNALTSIIKPSFDGLSISINNNGDIIEK